MRRLTSLLAASCLVWGIGCEEGKKEGEAGKEATPAAAPADKPAEGDKPAEAAEGADDPAAGQPAEVADAVKDIGVEPGAFEYEKEEGGEAVLTAATGTVEVRRVGTETWEAGKADDELHPGDQVRAADGASATVTLADETAVEVAEESAIAIGSREATEDPSSTAAVLYGVARFTVAPRAEGEGPFLVYAVNGVVAAKGTVYTVGTAASGETRVGVEEGAVEVSGGAKLDAPVAVDAGKAVVIAPEGQPGAVEAAGTVDWGTWRDEVEARVKAEEAAKFHADRAAKLEAELKQAYADLEAQTKAAEEAEARAKAAEQAEDARQYEAAAPEIGASVDASFALSNRLQYLTYAMLADAYIADSLYVRHPTVVRVIDPVRPRLATAILWHKKYHFVTYAYLRPMRPWYYVHTPVGRARARFVAYTIPPWYARVNLRYRPVEWRARVRTPVFRLPAWKVKRGVRKTIFVEAPRVGWYAGVRARVRPARARVAWYVKPKAPKARIVVGMRPAVAVKTVFKVRPPRPRAQAVVRFGGRMRAGARGGVRGGGAANVKVKAAVDTPDVDVGGRVKAGVDVGGKVKAGAGGAAIEVRDRAGGAVKAGAGAVEAGAGAVEAGVGRVKAGAAVGGGVDIKAGVGGRVKAGADGGGGGRVKAGADGGGGAAIGVKAGAGGRVKAGTPVEKNPAGGKGDGKGGGKGAGKDGKKKKKGKAGEGGAGGN